MRMSAAVGQIAVPAVTMEIYVQAVMKQAEGYSMRRRGRSVRSIIAVRSGRALLPAGSVRTFPVEPFWEHVILIYQKKNL